MTTLYRERRRIDRPAELVARGLSEQLGSPSEETERRREWRYDRLGGLYRYRVVLDAADGSVTVAVGTHAGYRVVSLAGLLLAGVVALLGAPEAVLVALLWGYAAVALLPVAHLLPGVPADRPDLDAEATSRRLTGYSVPPFLVLVAVLWAGLQFGPAGFAGGRLATGVVLALVAVGGGAYAAAGSFRGRSRPPDADPEGVPAAWIALAALLPGVVALANGLVAGSVLADVPTTAAAGLALVVVVALDAAFFAYCRIAVESLATARIAVPSSRLVRAGTGTLQLGATVVLAAGTALVVGGLGAVALGSPPDLLAGTFAALSPSLRPLVALLALAAVAPLLVVAACWAYHLGNGLATGVRALVRSEPLDPPAGVDASVRVVALGLPVARPVALPGRRFVLVDRTLVDALPEAELAAVLAHEAYHLRSRDPATSFLVALASLAVGGRNAALAFVDYAAIERRADDHAVERVGPDALVRALRSVQRLRYEQGLGSQRGERTRLELARDTLFAPYRLLFGSLLLDRAHAGVDERIARILDER